MNISIMILISIVLIAGIVAFLCGYIVRKVIGARIVGSAEQQAKNLILDAEKKSENIIKEKSLEAKEEAHKIRNNANKEVQDKRIEIQKIEQRAQQKEDSLNKKLDDISKKEGLIIKKEQSINDKHKQLDAIIGKQNIELERIAGLTPEEAKKMLLNNLEKDVRKEASMIIKNIESKAKEDAEKNAKEILTGAIQRCAADHVAESTISTVALPNDEMKGRIIGREGRNIRAIENLTGIDLIIDDTPDTVILSGFDPIRREIARLSLEKLIIDGRIHPARIEEMIKKSEKEVAQIIKDEGEQAVLETDVYGLHPELIKLLGRLKYRTSFGQNVLKHSIEVSHLAGLMASELGLDDKLAKRAGLLHDIGKALDHEKEGTHVNIGMEVLRKYKEKEETVMCMASHHGDYEPTSLEAVLVSAADALSAARPGARREALDTYVKRLQNLEEIANNTEGVANSYAIQAGREIRIIANPDNVKDDEIAVLARDISKKIEAELQYPGQIKVNVVRETRAIDYAK